MSYEKIATDMVRAAFGGEREIKAKFAQDLINLKDIVLGMIITKDDRYLKVLEIEPINFHLKEAADQDNIINTYESWLKVAPSKCQFKITVDLKRQNAFVDNLIKMKTEARKTHDNDIIDALYDSNIEYINAVTSRTAIERRHFLIFEFEANKREAGKDLSYEYIAQQLDNVAYQAKEYFGACGNSIVTHEDENLFLGEFFYEHLNRTSSRRIPFLKRAKRVIGDAEKINRSFTGQDSVEDMDYVNIISPFGISQKTLPDGLIYDNGYHAYYYVPSDGYPIQVPSGWLSTNFATIPGVEVDIFWRKINKADYLRVLTQQMKFTRHKVRSRTDVHSDYTQIMDAYQSQKYMQDALSDQNSKQDPFYVISMISVHADTYEELQEKCEVIERKALTTATTLSLMNKTQDLGFRATLPLNDIPRKLYYKARRNVTTEGLAGFYPLTQFELNDSKGIFLGINLYNNTVCTLDVYNRDKYSNANMVILGGSGAGKTYTLSLIAERYVLLGKNVYLITSKKGHEFRRLCDALGGSYIKFASSQRPTLNIFDIRPEAKVKDVLYGAEGSVSWLAKKSASILGWVQLLFKDLNETEKLLLDNAVKTMYTQRGITDDNNSIYEDNDPSKPLKTMPVMEDLLSVLDKINENPKTPVPQRIFSMLLNFVTGTYSNFNGQTDVDLSEDRRLIVFDLEDLADTVEPATIHLVLDYIWSKVKEDPTIQKTIMIEEGWSYLSEGASEASAKLIQEIFKVIRGYGGNAVISTQEINDILGSVYGKSVIECSALKILMGVEEGSEKRIKEYFRLQNEEAERLKTYRKGAALLLAGHDHIPIQFQASALEHELISTDYNDLAALYKRIQEENVNNVS